MLYSIEITAGDVTTRTKDGRTRIDARLDATDAVSVSFHPREREDFIALAERLTDAEQREYDNTRWITGELAPGVKAIVFIPAGVTATLA